MISDYQISTLRKYVADAFKPGMEFFPHFTLHGIEHLNELERLALTIRDAAELDPDAVSLVRVASILHDFAMVDVPSPDREAQLRQQMDPTLSFADVVRKTHQDEIQESLRRNERVEYLTRLLTAGPSVLEDVVTIARFHRFHPLTNAPTHLKGHCALMRLIDELDIGPLRAPLAAYEARRERMDPVAKLHWLKHICTRAVRCNETLHLRESGEHTSYVLTVSVAVLATERSWRSLQDIVLKRLQQCLSDEGVNAALSERFGFRVEVAAAQASLSGPTSCLPGCVRDDLEALVDSKIWEARPLDGLPRRAAAPPSTPTVGGVPSEAAPAVGQAIETGAQVASSPVRSPTSVVSHADATLSSTSRARRTLARIVATPAVQMKARGSWLCS